MAKILVVDDDKDILRLMQFTLEKSGHKVLLANNGPQGLDLLRSSPPDLIIADIMMPEMTGYEFTRQVRETPGAKNLPLLIYSARFQPIDKQTAIEAGATDYLPKNVSPGEIINRINSLLQSGDAAKTAQANPLLAFFSLRGGVGVTCLAVNVGVALALSRKQPVSLIDLNPTAGHTGLMLNLRPKYTLQNITKAETPYTDEFILSCFTQHTSGVQLLASPLISDTPPDPEKTKTAIRQLRPLFACNLVDLPHTVTAITDEALLKNVTKLVLILSPDVPSLQSAAAATQILNKQGVDPQKIVPVLNRNTPVPGLSAEAIEKTLRRPLAAEIPFEPKMLPAINNGNPLVLYSPQSVATTAIAQLAAKLIK